MKIDNNILGFIFYFIPDFGVKCDPDMFLTGLMRFTLLLCHKFNVIINAVYRKKSQRSIQELIWDRSIDQSTEFVSLPLCIVSTTTSGTLDAEGLLKLSANASSLNATQVEQILSQLESLLSGPNVSLALANTSVNIVNNLLDVPVAVMTPFSKR